MIQLGRIAKIFAHFCPRKPLRKLTKSGIQVSFFDFEIYLIVPSIANSTQFVGPIYIL